MTTLFRYWGDIPTRKKKEREKGVENQNMTFVHKMRNMRPKYVLNSANCQGYYEDI